VTRYRLRKGKFELAEDPQQAFPRRNITHEAERVVPTSPRTARPRLTHYFLGPRSLPDGFVLVPPPGIALRFV